MFAAGKQTTTLYPLFKIVIMILALLGYKTNQDIERITGHHDYDSSFYLVDWICS